MVIREAIRARSALTMLVYNKSLKLSSQHKSQLGAGRILNMATTDTNRILDLFYYGAARLFVADNHSSLHLTPFPHSSPMQCTTHGPHRCSS